MKHPQASSKTSARFLLVASALAGFCAVPSRALAVEVDAQLLQQLQETIRQQQEQLSKQAETLNALQKQVNELQQATGEVRTQAARAVTTAQHAVDAGRGQGGLPAVLTSGNENVKLQLSGQVHRALAFTNDGRNTGRYFVDHTTSGTRLNFVATGRMNEDLTLGSRIELAIAPDNSSLVSQSNPNPGDLFNQRWMEVSLSSRKYGKLSLGKGDTASNTTAEVDLSGTLPIQNSSVADLFFGMLFRERVGNKALTGIKISNAFSNFDGLSRESRLRYDTPSYSGFSLATSLVSNQRSDAALFWNGEGYGFKAAGAMAVVNPNIDRAGYLYDGSFSLLHRASGLNLTLSSGWLERNNQPNDANRYAKLGWLTSFNSLGKTAFVVDYTRSENMPTANDRGHSLGAGIIQFIDKYDTEIYLLYRQFSLDRYSGPAVMDLRSGAVGARYRF